MMRDCLQYALCLLCLVGSGICMAFYVRATHVSDDSPLVVLPGPHQDIGMIRQGTSTTASFKLNNVGNDSIQVLDVATSCGCASFKLSRERIVADESATISLTIESGQARGPMSVQALILYKVLSEDKPRRLGLRVYGKIDPEFDIVPEQLEFKRGVASSQQLILSPRHIKSLRIEKATCDKRFFTAKVIDTGKDDVTAIKVTFDPVAYYPDAGPAHLLISSNCVKQPRVNVPLTVVASNTHTSEAL